MNFSVVLPIHNEANMLRFTLRSIYDLQSQEILFGLDRCSDATERIINSEARLHPDTRTRISHYSERDGAGWRFRGAYLRRTLYYNAENDTILNTSADIRLDPAIRKHLPNIPKSYGLISFHYYEKPWNIQCFQRALINRVRSSGFAGLLAFSKRAWLQTEDLEELQNIQRAEDTHLHLAISKRYPVTWVHTHSLHLRPNESATDHYNRGAAMYQQLHIGAASAFIRALAMLRPAFFAGYMHSRRGSA